MRKLLPRCEIGPMVLPLNGSKSGNRTHLNPRLSSLGTGERSAIALAQETSADALLIDERAGRREAERRHLRVIGTLAVLEEAGRRGLLNFAATLEQLRQTSFRLSPLLLRAFSH